jgi:diaminohydroxyphosphoribosylaminopyrimidine deaminase/5-amino-6-(5-phosphoribosylamino)uracil reductase
MGEERTSLLVRLFDEPSTRISDPHLARAFALAEKGRGRTHPNPVVGCVLVRDGEVVGEGYHERAGGPHAEVVALEAAGSAAENATAYVTLEPCNHTGQTPPCTEALLRAGVAAAVIGSRDPNPSVSGGGVEALRTAGVSVEFSDDAEIFEAQNADWRHWVLTGRPWVTLKTALSLDGRATGTRDVRTSISGPAAREVTMRLRERATAVAVGARTALIDQPRLDVEPPVSPETQPMRVVLSGGATTSPGALAEALGDDPARPWTLVSPNVAAEASAQRPASIDLLSYAAADGLRGALDALGGRGVVHLLVEAGPTLFTVFWDKGLIDQLVTYHTGAVLGPHAPDTYRTAGLQPATKVDRRFSVTEAGIAGDDAVTVWRPAHDNAA